MEDRHTVIANYQVGGSGGLAADGILRSFAAIYDGHNGAQTAEEASSRWGGLL
jgi:serine/threonine protein phosphatase PrpC